MAHSENELHGNEIAIIGLAGRFPGAPDIDTFWQNLKDGVEAIVTLSDEELTASGVEPALLQDPLYVKRAAALADADCFDAAFFGYTPREAELMDPQQRVFLECAHAALEHAGYDPERYAGLIGVFGAVAHNSYLLNNIASYPELRKAAGGYQVMLGNDKDFPATRVAYKLNLRGPAVNVQTACSSSAVAIHLACQSLLSGDSDLVLVGGGRILAPSKAGYLYVEGGTFAPDGHCRAFDADAKGMVKGSGVGFVVLKRLAEALQDRDAIHAVIKGSAINNDGADKIGFTAPSVGGQSAVVADALNIAEVSPDTVSYIEAHGTGTPLGDPIEVSALSKAFGAQSDHKGFCALGSVKTNVGHLDAGAGVTGVIKTVLALEHKQIPPSLNFKTPNPQIDFANSPFFVNDSLKDWPRGDTPRRAGVNSLGLGGTNAHIVLEEAPETEPSAPSRPYQLLLLSAKTEDALDEASSRLARHLSNHSDSSLADIAFTLQTGRQQFKHRRMLVCGNLNEAGELLAQGNPRQVITQSSAVSKPSIAFMFSGQGAQYVHMAAGLYKNEPVFSEVLERCATLLKPHLDFDLLELLYPSENEVAANERLTETAVTQPILFAVEYALAQLWMSWGVKPAAMIGHSLGEYVAACLAGVFSLESALKLVAMRGRLMQSQPSGTMLSVPLPEEDILPLLAGELSLAVVNTKRNCVVAGTHEAIEGLEKQLAEREIEARALHTSHAFHSAMMEPILADFREEVRQAKPQAPTLPFVSNVTGDWITAAEATDPAYWSNHIRQTVRFADGLDTLLADSSPILLEVGPGQTLASFAKLHPAKASAQAILTSLRHPKETMDDERFLLNSLGRLWLAGAHIDWTAFYARERRQRVPLPTYPFERKRYWLEPLDTPSLTSAHPLAQNTNQVGNLKPEQREEEVAHVFDTMMPVTKNRKEQILTDILDILHDLSGIAIADLEVTASFLELGFDSLFLTQANTEFRKKFRAKLTFRQLFEETPTPATLATYLDEQLPPETRPSEVPQPAPTAPAPEPTPAQPSQESESQPFAAFPQQQAALNMAPGTATSSPEVAGALERVINQQLQLMTQQLALLHNGDINTVALPPSSSVSPSQVIPKEPPATEAPRSSQAPQHLKPSTPIVAETGKEAAGGHGPWKPMDKGAGKGFTPSQQKHLDDLIARFTSRTKESKRLTQIHRATLADPRTAAGFRLPWKELVYPIVSTRSSGSKLWDVDGNEWLDIAMGFGVILFGHSPQFITDAMEEQLKHTIAIGPQTPLAGKAAELICTFTGMERAAFCNTGSEAVLAALRIARTVTGRKKTVMFSGDYHGIFDEVLVRGSPAKESIQSLPVAPGISRKAVEDTLVLDFGDPASLEIIEAHADELAAVLVEPVQSRILQTPPQDYYQKLRALTERLDIPLIFDEVITGFRIHPGGAQAWFGIQADIATYGKVIGGGMPIGVVAGKAKYLDALDGGMWHYGDSSVPEVGVTWFAGTFVRHPLTMAAVYASLNHLKEQGPQLQEKLNDKTARLAHELNEHFQKSHIPIHIAHFASLFRIDFQGDPEFAALFWHHLRDRGVHCYEGRTNFLTTAHTNEDLAFLVQTFKEAAASMQEGGFLPPTAGGGPQGGTPSAREFADVTKGLSQPLVATQASTSLGNNIPLTEQQKEIWLACQFGRESSCSYNLSYSLDFKGSFDVPAMRSALQRVIDRHEALRMTFSPFGESFQVSPGLEVNVRFVDLSEVNAQKRKTQVDGILANEAETAFDLVNGPLVRAQIVKLGHEHHLLVFTVHHIASDGWGNGVIMRELAALYSAESTKDELQLQLSEPPSYTGYAQWQREQMKTPEAVQAAEYWLEQCAGLMPKLDLPADRPRPPIKTFPGGTHYTKLDSSLLSALKRVGAQRGSTMFATVVAGFTLLLHRLTGQDDVMIGIPASGQAIAGVPNLVGHCAHHHPLRSKTSWDATFSEHLRFVKGLILDGHEHRNYTEGMLLPKLKLPRDPSRLPLINVHFNIDPAPLAAKFHGLESTISFNNRHYFTPDIGLNVVESKGELLIRCEYNTDLFDLETIKRWLGHYQSLVEGVVANPDWRIGDLPLLSEAERRQLLIEWNDTKADYPQDTCVHQLFEAQVKKTPEAVAVVFEDRQLSYRALNAKANQLARYLQGLGVGPGVLVGIHLERSLDMMTGLLAVLKAGGIYVPLDPTFPQERLSFMMADAEVTVLLSQTSLANVFSSAGVPIVCLDQAEDWRELDSSNPELEIDPESLAYILYTSGSTGQPKGVMIPQQALTNFLCSVKETPGITAKDKLLAVTTLSFDIAGLELFLPLITGAEVEVASSEIASDGFRLRERLEQGDISLMQATPATWRLLVEAGWQGSDELTVFCGGEAFPRDLADMLLSRAKEVWNMYGPTESTIWSAVSKVERGQGAVRIGRPLANTSFYVLDERQQPLPVGVPGELYIGGDGLALGYLNRPELTAEKFVTNPFIPGTALYRTGDLVRHDPNGTLEFLGRLDQQVKLRGYRIELGEIETQLNRHPAILESAVIAREGSPGDKRLVAYFTSLGGAPGVGELRDFLKARLPDYMLPSTFVSLDAFPLTPNNKVDRKALPVPDLTRPALESGFTAPRTESERQLAHIWQKVLGLEKVGVFDNFFELGGDSMLGIQVITKANQANLRLTPRHLFGFQTVAELAKQVGQAPQIQAEQGTVIGEVPLSPNQLRFLVERGTPDPHHWNISTLLKTAEPLEPALLEETLRVLLEHHDSLRLRLKPVKAGWQQVSTPADSRVPFSSTDLSQLRGEAQRQALEEQASELQASLDLENGPLLRVAHFRLGEGKGDRLLGIVHHFAIDAFSWPIFWGDFETVYGQLRLENTPLLPPKTTPFKTWAQSLKTRAQSTEVKEELAAWLELPWYGVRSLPLDYDVNEVANTNGSARIVSVSLSAKETEIFNHRLPKHYRPEDVMATALTQTLIPWTGGSALLFDMMGHGRDDISVGQDLSRTVGFFISYTPKVLELAPNADPTKALEAVSKQLRDFPHKHFDLLRYLCEDSTVQSSLSKLPRAQVLFNYQGNVNNAREEASIFSPAPEGRGVGESPRGLRYYPLAISAKVEEQATIRFVYSENLHKRKTIEGVAQKFLNNLRALIKSYQPVPAGEKANKV